MLNKLNKILFLTNSGNRGGGNIVLFELVKYLSNTKEYDIYVLFKSDGDIIEEFKSICSVIVYDFEFNKRINLAQKLSFYCAKLFHTNINQHKVILKKLIKKKFNLIYSNTIHNEYAIKFLNEKLNVPIIIHSHEQDYIIRFYKKNPIFLNQFEVAKHFISVCKKSTKALQENFSISEQKISQIYPGIKIEDSNNFDKNKLREELGIPKDIFVVIGVGTPHWIKGCDMFIQIAIQSIKKDEDILFYWIGGNDNQLAFNEMKYDIEKSGYKNKITLVPTTKNPYLYHSISDLLILTSRVDSFPLVNLQSGMFKVPVVCFQQSGCSEEIINEETGFCVPYADIMQIVNKILFLKKNPDQLKFKGERLYNLVVNNYNCLEMSQKIKEIIEKYVKK